jgi:hypothetical protein
MAERDFSTRWLRGAPRATRRSLKCWTRRDAGGSWCARARSVASSKIRRRLGRRGHGHVAVFRRASGERGGRRGSRQWSDMPGVSGAWCSITSFPWTRAPTSRPSSFMRSHRFQRASDLRFGPGPRGTMTGPWGSWCASGDRPRRVSRQRRCSEAGALRWQGQIARATRGRDLHLKVPFPRKPPDLLMAESPPTGGLSALTGPQPPPFVARRLSALTRWPA